MIEVTTRSYLKNKLDVPVYVGEKPANKANEYVLIETIDSGRVDMIDAVTMNFKSFSTSLIKAAELNLEVKKALFDFVEVDSISSCKYGGGSQSIDTQSKEYAYECIFNIFYME